MEPAARSCGCRQTATPGMIWSRYVGAVRLIPNVPRSSRQYESPCPWFGEQYPDLPVNTNPPVLVNNTRYTKYTRDLASRCGPMHKDLSDHSDSRAEMKGDKNNHDAPKDSFTTRRGLSYGCTVLRSTLERSRVDSNETSVKFLHWSRSNRRGIVIFSVRF